MGVRRADVRTVGSAMMARAPGAITLVVRLWFEAGESDPSAGEWRGEVKQVPSGQVFYFRGLDGLVERVREVVGEEA